MKSLRFGTAVALAALLLQGCGGGGGGESGGGSNPIAGTPPPSPPPVSTACSLRDRQLWVQTQMQEWYLFPETLPASLDPAPYATVQAYIDALTATARAQRRVRFFIFISSIKEDEAFFSSGAS